MAKNSSFNENTRVQVPAALHLYRLGYEYLDHIEAGDYDHRTNILKSILHKQLLALNPGRSEAEVSSFIDDLILQTDTEDLGREFFRKLTSASGWKMIDFDHPEANTWHCTTEFSCHNEDTDDDFRPDLTCFVNGIPVVFIEVKIPNNINGILEERNRINKRLHVAAFRRFFAVTQFMIFSNNQEYDTVNRVPIQGAFYATPSKTTASFNVFREEDKELITHCGYFNGNVEDIEKRILIHRNCLAIRGSEEYITNLNFDTPTNRLLTSLLSRERLLFLLRYGIAYVEQKYEDEEEKEHIELQKHIMRYQQFFATKAISRRLDEGMRGGVIWHTQGSGKTALSYYNIRYLTNLYSARSINTKFYFIVDRLDLMNQAKDEFVARGLNVRTAQSRKELMADLESEEVNEIDGSLEVMVVNIQKFATDTSRIRLPKQYNTKLQRFFFVDEAHRGYDPKGSFLANLFDADPQSIKIALTGTPLLKAERESWKVFGEYIHTYYYDKSIRDGFTLRLMREEIETYYKEEIQRILDELDKDMLVRKGVISRDRVIESENYLESLLRYITSDLERSRIQLGCRSIGGMIVCGTNAQARKMYDIFCAQYGDKMKAVLILHDVGGKEERKGSIEEFKKKDTIDFLIVNNMLLTGFDAKRLKKLYLCRTLDGHSLLQALTRVNRPYKDLECGYVVDFANIKQNFYETNNMYLKELNRTAEEGLLPGQEGPGDLLLIDPEEVKQNLQSIQDSIWNYNTSNAELFRKQIDMVKSLDTLYDLRHKLEDLKAMANQVRTFGSPELKKTFSSWTSDQVNVLIKEVTHRIERIHLLEGREGKSDVVAIINEVIASIHFSFEQTDKSELEMSYNTVIEEYERVRNEFAANFDQQEEIFIHLSDEFRRWLKERGWKPEDGEGADEKLTYLRGVLVQIKEINRRNNQLKYAYGGDEKLVRIHKRIVEHNERPENAEHPLISKKEQEVFRCLSEVRNEINELLWKNSTVLENEPFFNNEVKQNVFKALYNLVLRESNKDEREVIKNRVAKEYIEHFNQLGY